MWAVNRTDGSTVGGRRKAGSVRAEPWDALRANIVEQRGCIEVSRNQTVEGRGAQNRSISRPLFCAKAHSAVDWFNGLPLGQTHGDNYGLKTITLDPQFVPLGKNGWDSAITCIVRRER